MAVKAWRLNDYVTNVKKQAAGPRLRNLAYDPLVLYGALACSIGLNDLTRFSRQFLRCFTVLH